MDNKQKNITGLRLSNKESNRLTRESIQTALLQLMKNNEFEKITVTAIINRAGVSRSGFYRNYSSKEEVMEDICLFVRKSLVKAMNNIQYHENPRLFYKDIFAAIKENPSDFRLIMDAAVPGKYIVKALPVPPQIESKQDSSEYYTYIALVSSLRSVVIEWFRNGMTEDADFMAGILYGIFHK